MRSITFGIALTILGIMIMAHGGSSARAVQFAPVMGLLFLVGGIGIAVFANRIRARFES